MVFVALPIVVYYPTHLFLQRFAPTAVPEAAWNRPNLKAPAPCR
jgi:hypothetical protein